MEKDNDNVVSANLKYITECASIIYTKIKAIGNNFFLEDGSPSNQYLINVEDYRHGTISVAYKNGVIRVTLDGTNYNILFKRYKNNGFRFYNKELGLEYKCIDKDLGQNVHLKEILKTVGNTVEYFKYTTIDDEYAYILTYAIKDSEGTSCVSRYIDDKTNNEELIECALAHKEKMEEDQIDEIEDFLEKKYKENEETKEKRRKKIEAGIKSQIDNFTGKDYEVINFSLPQEFRYIVSERGYHCVLPDNVHNYDDGEYKRRTLEEYRFEEKFLKKNKYNGGEFEKIFQQYNELDDEEYLEEELEDEMDDCKLDTENYEVIDNRNKKGYVTESEIIEMADEALVDVLSEVYEITESCKDIENFVENAKKIIHGRKEKMDMQEIFHDEKNKDSR